jgi:hypothetical protein
MAAPVARLSSAIFCHGRSMRMPISISA